MIKMAKLVLFSSVFMISMNISNGQSNSLDTIHEPVESINPALQIFEEQIKVDIQTENKLLKKQSEDVRKKLYLLQEEAKGKRKLAKEQNANSNQKTIELNKLIEPKSDIKKPNHN